MQLSFPPDWIKLPSGCLRSQGGGGGGVRLHAQQHREQTNLIMTSKREHTKEGDAEARGGELSEK